MGVQDHKITEKDRPHCNTFWNKDNSGTIDNSDALFQMFDSVDKSYAKLPKPKLYFVAHNGSGFDAYIIMNDKKLATIIKKWDENIVKSGNKLL